MTPDQSRDRRGMLRKKLDVVTSKGRVADRGGD